MVYRVSNAFLIFENRPSRLSRFWLIPICAMFSVMSKKLDSVAGINVKSKGTFIESYVVPVCRTKLLPEHRPQSGADLACRVRDEELFLGSRVRDDCVQLLIHVLRKCTRGYPVLRVVLVYDGGELNAVFLGNRVI